MREYNSAKGEFILSTEHLRSIVRVINANYESTWDGLTAQEIVAACQTCMDAGEWGYATPEPFYTEEGEVAGIVWMCEDDEIARWVKP